MNSMLIRIGFVCTSLFLAACQSEIETPVQEVQSSTYVDEKDSSLAANSLAVSYTHLTLPTKA